MFRPMMIAAWLSTGLTTFAGLPAMGEVCASATQSVPAQEAWQQEFEDICSKTQNAMTFSQEELAALISRCDALHPQIEKLDETRKKVYLGRLRMCRGLYANVLDAKRTEKK